MRNAEIGMRNSVEFGAWSVEFRHRGAENAHGHVLKAEAPGSKSTGLFFV